MFQKDITKAIEDNTPHSLAEVFRFISFSSSEQYGPHCHFRIEINFVKSGKCKLIIEDKTVIFKENEMMVIFSNAKHSFVAGDTGCSIMQLEFMPTILNNFESSLGIADSKFSTAAINTSSNFLPPYLKIVNDHKIINTVKSIINELTSKENYYNTMTSLHYGELLIYLYRYIDNNVIPNCDNRRVHELANYINENYSSEIPISRMSTLFGISERYIRKLFSQHIGLSPNEYLNKVRIKKAMDLLSDPDAGLSIKEVGFACGFATSQYFSKIFKHITSLSPREYLLKRDQN